MEWVEDPRGLEEWLDEQKEDEVDTRDYEAELEELSLVEESWYLP